MILRFFLLAGLGVLGGCVTLPQQTTFATAGYTQPALNPAAIQLVSWNIEKGQARGWSAVMQDAGTRTRLEGADLLLFQEACDSPSGQATGLAPLLEEAGDGAILAVSFESGRLGCGADVATGVLTASRVAPLAVTALRSPHREFGLTPKTLLATTLAIQGSVDTLLVINAHLLNFELLGSDAFVSQLHQIADLVAAHAGPVILAGDLNTRDERRTALVSALVGRLGLRAVFPRQAAGRTLAVIGGHLPLDHVYYRGLALIGPGRIGHEAKMKLSDHNSLSVRFKLAGDSR